MIQVANPGTVITLKVDEAWPSLSVATNRSCQAVVAANLR